MINIMDELIELEIKKRELENSPRLKILFKLILKYNTFYSHKSDCEEAILLEKLINRLLNYDEVYEYYYCIDNINKLLEHIYFEDNGEEYSYKDLSTRKFILFKNR